MKQWVVSFLLQCSIATRLAHGLSSLESHQVNLVATPRSELEALGKVGLLAHLAACERNQQYYGDQEDYWRAQYEVATENLEAQKQSLSAVVNKSRDDFQAASEADKAKVQQLSQECDQLHQELLTMRQSYSAEYNKWWKMTQDLHAKLDRFHACRSKPEFPGCAAAEEVMLPAVSETRLHLRASLTPDERVVSSLILQVEDCEAKVATHESSIVEFKRKAQAATLQEIANMEVTERRLADHQRLSMVFNRGPRLDALAERKRALEQMVDAEKARLDGMTSNVAKARTSVTKLNAHLSQCAC
mmetsp:Transcript_26583/g.61052  ORF Transcript_26583/g.61052 Transcript_26583/m.61052 type:complete len:302 (-) Transcript_26583:33-938(-)